jgi:hypothetical protein
LIVGALCAISCAATSRPDLSPVTKAAERRDFTSGSGLFAVCTSPAQADQLACLEFLQGYVIGASGAAHRLNARLPYCAGDASMEEIREQVVASLRRNLWHRGNASAVLVGQSLEEAFPCRAPTGAD